MAATAAVVARAHAVAAGRDRGPASVRLRTGSGRWLSVHASAGPRRRARPHRARDRAGEVGPDRTDHRRGALPDLTRAADHQAVARGLSNPEIAAELYLSAHTVRDRLKAVFAKVGVGSRGELVAKLFSEHYRPALHTPDAAVVHTQY